MPGTRTPLVPSRSRGDYCVIRDGIRQARRTVRADSDLTDHRAGSRSASARASSCELRRDLAVAFGEGGREESRRRVFRGR